MKGRCLALGFMASFWVMLLSLTGCSDNAYTGSMLPVADVNKYILSDDESICLLNDGESACLKLTPKSTGGGDVNVPVIHIHPRKLVYIFYHEGSQFLRVERAVDTRDIVKELQYPQQFLDDAPSDADTSQPPEEPENVQPSVPVYFVAPVQQPPAPNPTNDPQPLLTSDLDPSPQPPQPQPQPAPQPANNPPPQTPPTNEPLPMPELPKRLSLEHSGFKVWINGKRIRDDGGINYDDVESFAYASTPDENRYSIQFVYRSNADSFEIRVEGYGMDKTVRVDKKIFFLES